MLLSSGCCSIHSVSQLYIYTLIREAYVLLGEQRALIVVMTQTSSIAQSEVRLAQSLCPRRYSSRTLAPTLAALKSAIGFE